MQQLLLVLLGITSGILGCQADCDACAAGSNVACISETQFQFCTSNQAAGPVYACPTGYYCTSQLSICQKNAALRACGSSCGECNDSGTFACTDAGSFALCLGSSSPSDYTGSCPEGYVCNKDLPTICGNATETSATCPAQPETTEPSTESSTDNTTPESSTDNTTPESSTENTTSEVTTVSPDEVCRTAFNIIPIHAIPNDTECTSYIYCKISLKSWVGLIIDCPSSRPYFDGHKKLCGTTKATRPGCLFA